MKKLSSIFCFFMIMLTSTVCAEPTIGSAKDLRAYSGYGAVYTIQGIFQIVAVVLFVYTILKFIIVKKKAKESENKKAEFSFIKWNIIIIVVLLLGASFLDIVSTVAPE